MSNKGRPAQYPDAKGVIYEAFDRNALIGEGLAAVGPIASQPGWHEGALFFQRGATPGNTYEDTSLYVNIGSNLVAVWQALPLSVFAALALANRNVLITTSTLTISYILHDSRYLFLDNAGTLTTISLPAATGSGAVYMFIIGAVNTSNYVINTNGSDVFKGPIMIEAASPSAFNSTANKTITFNGTTTGGAAVGGLVQFNDFASGVWSVSGSVWGSGTLATPYSN